MRVLLAAVNSQFVHSSPALYALVRAAEGCAWQGELRTATYSITMSSLRILEDVYRQRPDVLAFSVYIWNVSMVKDLVRDLHLLLPETTILLGGPEVSGRPREYLQELPIDGIFIGEGEESFPAYLEALSQGEGRPTIAGLMWRGQEDDYHPAPRPRRHCHVQPSGTSIRPVNATIPAQSTPPALSLHPATGNSFSGRISASVGAPSPRPDSPIVAISRRLAEGIPREAPTEAIIRPMKRLSVPAGPRLTDPRCARRGSSRTATRTGGSTRPSAPTARHANRVP